MKGRTQILGFFGGAALFLGALYVYSGSEFHATPSQSASPVSAEEQSPQASEISFTVLSSGENAPGAKNRKNYAIYTASELASFWKIAGEKGKPPSVDFTKQYVIVVFAGTKKTSGYSIEVTHVQDTGSARSVSVRTNEPGDGCVVAKGVTSPYQFIQVPHGAETSLSHTDTANKVDCHSL